MWENMLTKRELCIIPWYDYLSFSDSATAAAARVLGLIESGTPEFSNKGGAMIVYTEDIIY